MEQPELDPPLEWARLIMPRRGGQAKPEPVRTDTDAAERIDRLVTDNFQLVESYFPPYWADLVLRKATARHLSTAPDPTGAAVLHLILGSLVSEKYRFGLFLDAWLSRHGPAFAAAAVLERCAMSSGYDIGTDVPRVRVDEAGGLAWAAECDHADLRRIRAAIAGADDYQSVVEALEARRSGPWRNTVAAFLAPSEISWVDESMEASLPNWFKIEWMRWHAVSTPDHLAGLDRRTSWPIGADTGMVATFLDGCGAAGLPVLASRRPNFGWGPAERPDLAAALTSAASPEAMRNLLARLNVKGAIALAGAVVRRFPTMSVRCIAERAAEAEAPPELRILLPSDPLVWQQIAPELSAAETAALEGLREVGPDTPVAALADLPPLLSEPPWAHPDRAPEPHPPMALAAPLDLELRWEEGEEANWTGSDPEALLAELAGQPKLGELLLPMAGLRPAQIAAGWLGGKPQARKASRAWLDRHGLSAVPWLAFDALSETGSLREKAAHALRYLAYQHGQDAVIAALAEPGEAARRAVVSILGEEALYDLPKMPPTIPDWADPSMLPPVWAHGKQAVLPVEAVEHLLVMLLLSASEFPYAALEDAVEVCDRESLERFSAAIIEQWERVGREKIGAKGWGPRQAELIGADGLRPAES